VWKAVENICDFRDTRGIASQELRCEHSRFPPLGKLRGRLSRKGREKWGTRFDLGAVEVDFNFKGSGRGCPLHTPTGASLRSLDGRGGCLHMSWGAAC